MKSPLVEKALDLSDQHSFMRSAVLHLLPGLLILLFYLITAPIVRKWGFPSIMALFVAIGVVLIPFELGFLLYQGKKKSGKFSLKEVIRFREPMPWWQYLVFGVLLFMWSGLVFGKMAMPVDKYFIGHFFNWVPDWFFIINRTNRFDQFLSDYSKPALVVTAIVNIVLNGLAGPIVEELYFRGYLLPRLTRFKGYAPLINALLFSLYHFFTPWENAIRILALVPMVYVGWWKRNIYIGMFLHCAGNLAGAIGLLVAVLK